MPHVTSKDGTKIAYDKLGEGPALIFVAGATCFRNFPPIVATAEAIGKHFTVYNYDRRGRGDSGDTQPFSVEREIEDIEALIDDAGGSAVLFGHSSGAALAFEATRKLEGKVKKLAMYEPPYCTDEKAFQEAKEFDAELKKLLDAGKPGDAMAFFLKDMYPAEMIEGMKQSPEWPTWEGLAHTLLYDSAAANRIVPTEEAAKVATPTLIMYADESYDFMRDIATALDKAMPNSELKIMKNQGHEGDPTSIAQTLADFCKTN